MSNEYKTLSIQGLWKNNPAIVQLLGLCPLLAVTGTLINGLGLGLATTLVLLGSNITVSLVRNFVPNEVRIPIFVMVIAAFVTVIELLMHAFTFGLYQVLGIFIPLIVTNCAIIGRAEAYASKNSVQFAAFDGLMMGAGFTLILVLLGGMREILGLGTLFSGADLIFGEWAQALTIVVYETDANFLLAILPPGAFIGLGIIIAAKNIIDKVLTERQAKGDKKVVQRARVTGTDI
jgi:electron transport complex protein RnfE